MARDILNGRGAGRGDAVPGTPLNAGPALGMRRGEGRFRERCRALPRRRARARGRGRRPGGSSPSKFRTGAPRGSAAARRRRSSRAARRSAARFRPGQVEEMPAIQARKLRGLGHGGPRVEDREEESAGKPHGASWRGLESGLREREPRAPAAMSSTPLASIEMPIVRRGKHLSPFRAWAKPRPRVGTNCPAPFSFGGPRRSPICVPAKRVSFRLR
jgi:hypothetical protein